MSFQWNTKFIFNFKSMCFLLKQTKKFASEFEQNKIEFWKSMFSFNSANNLYITKTI